MRSSSRSIAAIIALAVLLPAAGAFAEDTDVEDAASDGSQFTPAGPDAYVPKAGNLNSVPEDGTTLSETSRADSPLVKQILRSRPNEDLVICVAGCYSGANRVIYAQPSVQVLRGTRASQSMLPTAPLKMGAADVPRKSAAANSRPVASSSSTN
jgi:hypothetical protein